MGACYTEIPGRIRLGLQTLLEDIAVNDDPWLPYHAFEIKPVSQEVLDQDDFYRRLARRFPFEAAILKIRPNICYKWHHDTNRLATVNLLVMSGHSHCIFETDNLRTTCSITELEYKPRTRYLFNCAVRHEVINFDQDRYTLSLEFKVRHAYQEIRNWLA